VQVGQGRPHIFCDMRLVDDKGRELPRDGQAVGNLQVSLFMCKVPQNSFIAVAGKGRMAGSCQGLVRQWETCRRACSCAKCRKGSTWRIYKGRPGRCCRWSQLHNCACIGVSPAVGYISSRAESRVLLAQAAAACNCHHVMVSVCAQVRGPHIVQQYHRHEKQTVDKDKWFDTGELSYHSMMPR
jgi:acyl-CoA synthetase (AMP-forming)/AMP-acid ligase II